MKLREVEEERDKELASKYRDRVSIVVIVIRYTMLYLVQPQAKERRDGANPDYPTTADMFASSGLYKAVAPDVDP